MAKGFLDDANIDTPCPACGKKTKQSLGRLRAEPEITCPACGETFKVDFKGDAGMKKLDKSVDDLRKTLRNLSKRR